MTAKAARDAPKSLVMGTPRIAILALLAAAVTAVLPGGLANSESLWQLVVPEQRRIRVRHPSELPHAPVPDTPAPPTVSSPHVDAVPRDLSLDEAIRTALVNANVVRVLTGVTAVSSGRTIYDAAITNTTIDLERALFDPTVSVTNTWDRFEPPVAVLDPLDPTRTIIGGTRTDDYDMQFDLSKTTTVGGLFNFGVGDTTSRFQPGVFPLNPENRTSLELSYTQPLLQGGGAAANVVPIVVARINTERSYFQYKDSVQDLVRGVVEAYWALVFARTDLWAREQQVEQAQFAFEQAEARAGPRVGEISGAEVAQTRVALANFRASLVAAKASVLQQEAALRNILGLPLYDADLITPISPPSSERLEVDWNLLMNLAEEYRPDIIELKLILEADQQLLLQARNLALPRVDGVSLYRWNGLEGTMPSGDHISSPLGRSTDWTLGVNFSVPLGLRQGRAQVRQQELIIARDRANLEQGIYSAVFSVALNVRNLDQFYEQYLAFRETRIAARDNLEAQMTRYRFGVNPFINVLQAIVDWGNAVSSEAQALTQYNTELARLQRETGTILETHGIRFYEERYGSIGPLGRLFPDVCYPQALPPTENNPVYPTAEKPSEEFFDLEDPLEQLRQRRPFDVEELPPLRLPPVTPPSTPDGVQAPTPQ
jgi:outer membrane protein TolC